MKFDVSEYTLAFRRVRSQSARHDQPASRWMLLRPGPDLVGRGRRGLANGPTSESEVAEVFIVPLCSTLALDDLSYERFLHQSGVLDDALDLLTSVTFAEADSVETIRKEIQSLIMAAEVQHIVDGMSA